MDDGRPRGSWITSYDIFFVSACPDGWELKPEFGKCYYYLYDGYYNWIDANARCAALDPDTVATLTSVRSQEENDYVQSLFNDSGTSFDDRGRD